ncbi:MAG: transporter substrate-binding domain-containing protein [Desulfonatronovibrionaceae bacterium]
MSVWSVPAAAAREATAQNNFPSVQQIKLTPSEIDFLQDHPVIRVGNEDDWPPFDFSQKGDPKGYAIEHLELLGHRLGISFEYVNGYTWAELLELFRQGKIDLLPSLWYSDDRAEYMHFTEPYLVLPYVIVTHSGNQNIREFSHLFGRTVSVARGYVQENVLKKHYPQIKQHQVNNVLEGLKAVSYGQADAYIGYHGSVSYLISSNFLYDLKIVGETGVPELGPQGLYISVRKDLEPLRDIMQKAMDSLPEDEKIRLREKWITVEQAPRPGFNAREKRFLEENPVLTVDNMRYWAPFNFTEQGQARGFAVDYMELLARRMGVELEFVSGPSWNEFMNMLKTKELDILCDVVRTEDREEFIAFTRPYFDIISGIVVRREKRNQFTGIRDLAGKRVAVPQNFYYQEILEKNFPGINVIPFDNPLACLKAVSSEAVDAALSEKAVFDHLINKYFLSDLDTIPITDAADLESSSVSIGVSRDREVLLGILEKAMDTVSVEELDRLRDRWLRQEISARGSGLPLSRTEQEYIQDKEAVSLCVNPDWSPFEQLDRKTGRYTGMAAGIMELLSIKTGLDFQARPTDSWAESLEMFRNGRCDMIAAVQKFPADEQGDILVSKPYLESITVIVSRNQQAYVTDMASLAGSRVGITQDDPALEYIKGNYPGLELKFYQDSEGMLQDIDRGKLDFALGNLHLLSSRLHELGLYSLKIVGQTPYKEFFRLGVNPGEPLLRDVMDKAISHLNPQDVDRVVRNWISIRYEQGMDYTLVWQIGLGSLFLITFFLYWNRKLHLLNSTIARARKDLEIKNQELERLSTTDSLTEAYNRMKMEAILDEEILRASRSGEPLSLILLDIDKFKIINDTLGHQTGDMVLVKVAELLRSNIRRVDSLGRWGGEEFIIVCPFTDSKGAWQLAEKLRLKIMTADFEEAGTVTASFGVSSLVPDEDFDHLLKRSDQAMYKAKQNGRNRTEIVTAWSSLDLEK